MIKRTDGEVRIAGRIVDHQREQATKPQRRLKWKLPDVPDGVVHSGVKS